jgi:NOL1/NOP2/fmu family ribosome biogenesis protein
MKFDFYDSKRRKKLTSELNELFGISEIPKVLFETGKEKIRGFSGDLNVDEIYLIDKLANVEFLGLYLFKRELGHLRMGFDGTLLFKNQVVNGIVDINQEQAHLWMRGHNLDVSMNKGVYVIRFNGDFLGCTISDGRHLINFVPKERRIRKG